MRQVRCNGEDDEGLRIGGQGEIKSVEKSDYTPATHRQWDRLNVKSPL